MLTPDWKSKVIAKDKQFTYKLEFLEEEMSPRQHFLQECEWHKEDYESIKNYYWFCAKIIAYRGSVECGEAYLGGCCYKNLKEVMGDSVESLLGGYGPRLVEEARQEAKDNLKRVSKEEVYYE